MHTYKLKRLIIAGIFNNCMYFQSTVLILGLNFQLFADFQAEFSTPHPSMKPILGHCFSSPDWTDSHATVQHNIKWKSNN